MPHTYADPTDCSPDPLPPNIGEDLGNVTLADMETPHGRMRVMQIASDTLEDIDQLRRELHGATMRLDASEKKYADLMHKIEQLVF